jgi:NAD(P)-dependent dehydrogenase (short-subunit alcohol dehydrogenase family)
VSNAGIGVFEPMPQTTLETWNRVLATNLTAAFLLAKAAAADLRAAHGAIVTIASTRAHMSEPDTLAYSASKGGLVALTHALAVGLGPDVRVNCVSPGWIATKGPAPTPTEHAFHPAGRVGRAEDIAALVAFLLGPDAGFITGAEFICDGGVTRKMIYPE